jgi:hypothetical protein
MTKAELAQMTDVERLLWEAADITVRRELGEHPGIYGDDMIDVLTPLRERFLTLAANYFDHAVAVGELVEEEPGGVTVPQPIEH